MTIELHQNTAPAPIIERNGYDLIRSTALAMADANAIAKAVANTDMVPKHFRGKPDDLTAAILFGATLGFDPMQSSRQVYVIHGQAALYARAMAALVMSAGHEVWTVSSSPEGVTVNGRRRGSEHVETSTWTADRAKRAEYTSNAKYRTNPEEMLYAKAVSEVCRKIAPDVLNGVYSVEEMRMERVESERVDQPTGAVNSLRAALNPSPAPGVATPAEPAPVVSADASGAVDSGQRASAGEVLLNTSSALAKALFASMGDKGIQSREDRLEYASMKLGRPIASSKELTEADARALLLDLDSMEDDTPLIDVAAEQPTGADQ